jgi:hypothetical protein
MSKSASAFVGFFELIALTVAFSIWIKLDYASAGAVALILCVVWLFTLLSGKGLPRFKHRGKAFLALIISASFMMVAGSMINEETEGRLAELKGTDETAYLELLKSHDEDRWLTELSKLKPDEYAAVTKARREEGYAKAQQKRQDACTSGREGYAYVMMQSYVKERLKAPSTADFPTRQGKGTKHLGDCLYQVVGTFDAQNGFGAMIRGRFEGRIRYFPDEEAWQAVTLNIDG